MNEEAFMKRNVKAVSLALSAVTAVQSMQFVPAVINAAEPDHATVVSDTILSGAEYNIVNKLSGKLVTAGSDGNVMQSASAEGTAQSWLIISSGNGYYRLVPGSDRSMALTVEDTSAPNGGNICIAEYTGGDAQLFSIEWDGSAYYLTTKCSEGASALDVKGKSRSDGANIHQYKYQGNDNQRFDITPVGNEYSWIRGDLDFNGVVNCMDLTRLKQLLAEGAEDPLPGIADLNADGKTDSADGQLMLDFLLSKNVDIQPYYKLSYNTPEISEPASDPDPVATPVQPEKEGKRKMEYLDRGVYAVSTGKNIFVSWRSLADDADGIAFNVYRTTDGTSVKLNDEPITDSTNFTDKTADLKKNNTYAVKAVVNGTESDTDGSYTLNGNSTAQVQILDIKKGGEIHFVWAGDFNGDGAYDYLVDRCADNHQKLEAYLNDGTYLWTVDMGVNSENKNNITPGASTIDVGMWDGVTTYDMDSDGYCDVIVRIADGVQFGDGETYMNPKTNAQAIAVIDGRTGALKAEAPVPDDYIKIGPMACMMEIGYLDGVNPSVICWLKNRNKDKSFNSINAAYGYENGKFTMRWKYDNKNSYAEAHQIRVADVDYDGKDEVLHMGYCIDGNGKLRYHMDDIIHGDRWFVGSFKNANNGNQMMGYGVQQRHTGGLLEYIYNAATGKIIWTNYSKDTKELIDVGRGNVGDIDPRYEGYECWSFQGLYTNEGMKISSDNLYPSIRLWWDSDALAESYNDGKIEKWDYKNTATIRIASTWKMTDCKGSYRGAPMFYGDILGDWREEVIMTSADYSKLVILSTADETNIKLPCLAQDPCYRNCMTAKGYYQSHMTSFYIGDGMDMPSAPDIEIIKK